MGPDLLCFLEDQETKDLIFLAVQHKVMAKLNKKSGSLWWIVLTPRIIIHFRYVTSIL